MNYPTATKRCRLSWTAFALSCALVGAGNNVLSHRIVVEAFAAISVGGPGRKLGPRVLRAARYGDEGELSSSWRRQSTECTGPQQSESSKRTLYDILRCSPDATREELKARYNALARESHPDAVRGRPNLNDSDRPDFNEVARAWKLLSDSRERMKYDRSLKAERFTEDVENLAAQVFDMFAAPLVRRKDETTATGTNKVREGEDAVVMASSVDLSRALTSAVRASHAERAIDRMEVFKKPQEPEVRMEKTKLARTGPPRDEMAMENFCIASRMTGSHQSGTTALATIEGLDTIVTEIESLALLKETLNAEIAVLEEAERQVRALKLQDPVTS